jgi:hypothetical protein
VAREHVWLHEQRPEDGRLLRLLIMLTSIMVPINKKNINNGLSSPILSANQKENCHKSDHCQTMTWFAWSGSEFYGECHESATYGILFSYFLINQCLAAISLPCKGSALVLFCCWLHGSLQVLGYCPSGNRQPGLQGNSKNEIKPMRHRKSNLSSNLDRNPEDVVRWY